MRSLERLHRKVRRRIRGEWGWIKTRWGQAQCHLLGAHVGHIETALVDWEKEDLSLTFMPCQRCGRLVPMNLERRDEMLDRHFNMSQEVRRRGR